MHKTDLRLNSLLPKYEIIRSNLRGSMPISCYQSLRRFEASFASLAISPFCQTLEYDQRGSSLCPWIKGYHPLELNFELPCAGSPVLIPCPICPPLSPSTNNSSLTRAFPVAGSLWKTISNRDWSSPHWWKLDSDPTLWVKKWGNPWRQLVLKRTGKRNHQQEKGGQNKEDRDAESKPHSHHSFPGQAVYSAPATNQEPTE